jgi:hypothetical protein
LTPLGRLSWVPLLLAGLALADLSGELRLLADLFTWTSLVYLPAQHPLAIAVLVLLPSLFRRYR